MSPSCPLFIWLLDMVPSLGSDWPTICFYLPNEGGSNITVVQQVCQNQIALVSSILSFFNSKQ